MPYVTSTYNYGGAYGNQSSYSQLSVGVELDVTPFINPDGLVVMQIQQEIDDLNGYTTITGVGQIPNTIKRTLQSEITVSNMDTVVLGAFIKNGKSIEPVRRADLAGHPAARQPVLATQQIQGSARNSSS